MMKVKVAGHRQRLAKCCGKGMGKCVRLAEGRRPVCPRLGEIAPTPGKCGVGAVARSVTRREAWADPGVL